MLITGLTQFPLSIDEIHDGLIKIMHSDITPLGKILRDHLGPKWNSDELVSDLIFRIGPQFSVSTDIDQNFFVNEEKGFPITFSQMIEYQYMKEMYPNINLGFLFKNNTYSFFHGSYLSIHEFFGALLRLDVFFTINNIELVTLTLASKVTLTVYAVEFSSTTRMKVFYKVIQGFNQAGFHTLRPCAVNLDDLNNFHKDSEEKCMEREVNDLRIAISDALANGVGSAMTDFPCEPNSSFDDSSLL